MTIVIPENPQDLAVSTMRIAKCLLAGDTTGDTNMYDLIVGSGDSTAVLNLFQFPDEAIVYEVGWRVRTAFTAAQTITIGDSDIAAGWGAAADIGATVADTTIVWGKTLAFTQTEGVGSTTAIADTGTHPAYAVSARLMVADTLGSPLNLTATMGGVITTTGQLEIYALYSLMGRQRNLVNT